MIGFVFVLNAPLEKSMDFSAASLGKRLLFVIGVVAVMSSKLEGVPRLGGKFGAANNSTVACGERKDASHLHTMDLHQSESVATS